MNYFYDSLAKCPHCGETFTISIESEIVDPYDLKENKTKSNFPYALYFLPFIFALFLTALALVERLT